MKLGLKSIYVFIQLAAFLFMLASMPTPSNAQQIEQPSSDAEVPQRNGHWNLFRPNLGITTFMISDSDEAATYKICRDNSTVSNQGVFRSDSEALKVLVNGNQLGDNSTQIVSLDIGSCVFVFGAEIALYYNASRPTQYPVLSGFYQRVGDTDLADMPIEIASTWNIFVSEQGLPARGTVLVDLPIRNQYQVCFQDVTRAPVTAELPIYSIVVDGDPMGAFGVPQQFVGGGCADVTANKVSIELFRAPPNFQSYSVAGTLRLMQQSE